MSKTNAIRAGRAYVELFADDSGLVRGLRRAQAKLKAFGAAVSQIGMGMTKLGAAVAAPLLAASKVFAQVGSDLYDMSQRTGMSVEALSELGYAADLSGSSLSEVEQSIRRMQRTVADAADGSQSAAAALAKLGLTTERLIGLSPEQQFALIADGLARISDPTLRAAAAMDLFGRAGTKLLPMMTDGAAGLAAMREEARRLGQSISTQDAAAADVFGDAMDRVWKTLRRATFAVGAALAPTLTDLANRIAAVSGRVIQWLNNNRELIVTVLKVAAGVVAAGVAMVVLGKTITLAGVAIGGVGTILTTVGATVGVVASAIGALLTPIGLVATAVVGLGAYLIYVSGLGGRALGWLGDRFGELGRFVGKTLQGIKDALAAGDWQAAANVLWSSLKVAWMEGTTALRQLWAGFQATIVKVAVGAWSGMLAAAEYVFHGIKVAWIEASSAILATLKTLSSTFESVTNSLGDAMVTRWTKIQRDLGLITREEAQFRLDYVSRMQDTEGKQRQAELDRAMKQIDESRTDRRAAETARHTSALAQIGDAYNTIAAAADTNASEDVRRAREQLAAARAAWQASLSRAPAVKQPELGENEKIVAPLNKSLAKALASSRAEVAEAKQRIETRGTFSAFDVAGMGAGGVADRIAQASEQTARNTKQMLERLNDMDGAEFA